MDSKRRLLAVTIGCCMMSGTSHAAELHGHRGARGLVPENTIASFQEALRHGADCIETDIGMTRDGALVVHHDRSLNVDIARRDGRWIDAPRLLKAITLGELKSYDVGRIRPNTRYAAKYAKQSPADGAKIPLFRELLAMPELAAQPDVCLNLEIKTAPLAIEDTFPPEKIGAELVAELDRANFRSRVRIQSFDWRNLVYLKKAAPDIPLSFLTAERSWLDNVGRDADKPSPWLAGGDLNAHGGSLPKLIKAMGGSFWAPYYRDLTPASLAEAHALGLKVMVWTVNKESAMRAMLEMGADAIITDYPDIGRKVIDQWRAAHKSLANKGK